MVENISAVATFKQFRIKPLVGRPWLRMWSNANNGIELSGSNHRFHGLTVVGD
jgi:hypothetical protein